MQRLDNTTYGCVVGHVGHVFDALAENAKSVSVREAFYGSGLTYLVFLSGLKRMQKDGLIQRVGERLMLNEKHIGTIRAAQQSGCVPRPPAARIVPSEFAQRLWSLLRIRNVLDASEAASTLCDAGDERAFAKARVTAARYLARWCLTGDLALSERRGPNNSHRYVLADDKAAPSTWSLKGTA
jgi:hypothetical protein